MIAGSNMEKGVPVDMHGEEVLVNVAYWHEPPARGYLPNLEIEKVVTVEGRDITGELSSDQIEQITQWIIERCRGE